MRRALALLPLTLLACGPIPVQQAERECIEQARLAQKPQIEVFVGVNNRGEALTGGSFGISTDYLAGKDPSQVFESCVAQKSGKLPTRPLMAQPGWTG